MIIALCVVGFLLANALFAYVPIILLVGYNLRPRKPKDLLYEKYINDDLSTTEFVAAIEEHFDKKKHVPLR